MNDGSPQPRQIEVLRELGLSRTEAEVYVACLSLGSVGALSSYRVAQEMGRDPANVGKVVNSLVHWQAVRVVQDKPRLFVAVAPEAFASHLVDRLRRHGSEAVTLLESFGTPVTDGVAHALTSPALAYARARDLLAQCRTDAMVSGSPQALRELGADLELAAQRQGCRVRVLSPEAMTSTVVDIGHLPVTGGFGGADGDQWLHLVVDGTAWLTALLSEAEGATGPCGWWCRTSTIGRVLAETLEVCWRSAVAVHADHHPAAAEIHVVDRPQDEPATAPVFNGDVADGIHPAFSRAERVGTPPQSAPEAPAAAARTPNPTPAAPSARVPGPAAPGGPVPEPWSSPMSSAEADRAGFAFLFRHAGKSKKDGAK